MSVNIYTLIGSVLLLIFAVALIVIVILQEGNERGLSSSIGGSSDSFLSKNKSRTLDSFLAKWTKFIAIGFFVLALACDILIFL